MEGTTQLYGVIGHPVAHSLSPFMMNRAFRQRGIDAVYLRFDVRPESLERAVGGVLALGARGVNVTYPFKERVLKYVDVPSPDAQLIGAANTLVITEGRIIAHNTDAPGAANALVTFGGVPAHGKRIFIFGAGGSARAAAYGLLRAGAAGVTFGVRSQSRASRAVGRLQDAFPGQTVELVPLEDGGANEHFLRGFESADVVINATPVGMGGGEQPALIPDARRVRAGQCFFDFVYYPGRTAFLETAEAAGARIVGGVALLVCQATESFRQWTGLSFDAREMADALEAAFPERTAG